MRNASTPTVVKQIDTFLAGNKITNDDIFVVSAGVSDVIANTNAFLNGTITEEQLRASVVQAGADLAVQVRRLNSAGAKHIVVTGTYDLSRSPWAKAINKEALLSSLSIALNNSSFDTFIQELAPDIVLFDRFMMEEQFGWRVEKHCPQALRVLETSDLQSLRDARHQQLKARLKHDSDPDDFSALFAPAPHAIFEHMADTDLAQAATAYDALTQG